MDRTVTSGEIVRRTRDIHVVIEPRVVGLEVAADIYGLSADQLADLQDHHGLPMLRIGRRRLVPVAAADAWFAARVTPKPVAA